VKPKVAPAKRRAVRKQVASGPDRDALALRLQGEGLSSAGIAKRLRVSPARVRQILQRAKRRAVTQAAVESAVPAPAAAQPAVDLARIVTLRKGGLSTVADIARALGVPKKLLTDPEHADLVREALETGRVQGYMEAAAQYEEAIRNGNGNIAALLIFKMKQLGWTDRQAVDTTLRVTEGVADRLKDAIDKLREKWRKEGRA
jgi:predicted RNA polymerase sigma factor